MGYYFQANKQKKKKQKNKNNQTTTTKQENIPPNQKDTLSTGLNCFQKWFCAA